MAALMLSDYIILAVFGAILLAFIVFMLAQAWWKRYKLQSKHDLNANDASGFRRKYKQGWFSRHGRDKSPKQPTSIQLSLA